MRKLHCSHFIRINLTHTPSSIQLVSSLHIMTLLNQIFGQEPSSGSKLKHFSIKFSPRSHHQDPNDGFWPKIQLRSVILCREETNWIEDGVCVRCSPCTCTCICTCIWLYMYESVHSKSGGHHATPYCRWGLSTDNRSLYLLFTHRQKSCCQLTNILLILYNTHVDVHVHGYYNNCKRGPVACS